jgi:hypothetical protein
MEGGEEMIKPVRRLVRLLNEPEFRFMTDDGLTWDTLSEATEHDLRLQGGDKNPVTHAVYEAVTSIQQAINIASAENRVVRFLSNDDNKELRRKIDDLKGCKIMKPDRTSNDIAVVPPSIQNFDFNDVDTRLVLNSREG